MTISQARDDVGSYELLTINDIITLINENKSSLINLDILKAVVVNKASDLTDSPQHIQSIRDADSTETLQKVLNGITQAKFKDRLPLKPDEPTEEKSIHTNNRTL